MDLEDVNMDSEYESDNEINGTPPILKQMASNATQELLPSKSREVYENSYKRFMKWRQTNKATSFSENILVAYFVELSSKVKPSTLWGHFSMLKATLVVKNNINIGKYSKLIAYLKRKSEGYLPKKSKTLTKEQINQFVSEASDQKYLMTKVREINYEYVVACKFHTESLFLGCPNIWHRRSIAT